MNYISLFSGGGIGDRGFVKAGLNPIIMNELDTNRAAFLKANYPQAYIISGDIEIQLNNIVSKTRSLLNGNQLFMIVATPPCQGMSKNGIGTIKKAIRDGKRPQKDKRNYLFEPTLKIVNELRPLFFIWENVDRMLNTKVFDENGNDVWFTDYLENQLFSLGYVGKLQLHNMADFGVPQNRRRVIGVFIRTDYANITNINIERLFPSPRLTKAKYITVNQVIGDLPKLDSKTKRTASNVNFHPLHFVPVSRPELYYWIENTAIGQSAFENNTCPNCHCVSSSASVYCERCDALLPKPTIKEGDKYRLISGFISTYKRMNGDEPAPTITTRSAYACSDKNLHPTQNRVLSIYEIALLQGLIPNEFNWAIEKNGQVKFANATLLRDILGEPVSPIYSEILGEHLINILSYLNKAV